MDAYEPDMVMAPLDYMIVRVVGSPECPEQAKWVGRKGKVVLVNKRLPHWAAVQLNGQTRIRDFETKNLEIIGEHNARSLLLATGYTEDRSIISPTAVVR